MQLSIKILEIIDFEGDANRATILKELEINESSTNPRELAGLHAVDLLLHYFVDSNIVDMYHEHYRIP